MSAHFESCGSAFVALIFVSACSFSPAVPQGLPCSSGGDCPPGQTCNPADNLCYEQLPPVTDSGQPTPDAGMDAIDAMVPTCPNGEQDGMETDVDCGGPGCPGCDPDQMCMVPSDCASGVCVGLVCQAPVCGDGVQNQPAEECDTGPMRSDTEPDACRLSCLLPSCGDNVLDTGEEVDPPMSPSAAVPVDPATCRYDFTGVTQLYCDTTCGNWGGGEGCQQEDADALCKLLTGNPASTYIPAVAPVPVQPGPGVCCPPPTTMPGTAGCDEIDEFGNRGVALIVSVHPTNLGATHGTGDVISVSNIGTECTNP